MDSIEKLIIYYNKSEKGDIYHKVVECMLKNIHEIKDVTIYELADLCYSSPATISRLVKRLEFENYTDFKTQINYALKNYHYFNMNTRDVELVNNEDIVPFYFNFLMNNMMALKNNIKYEQISKISDALYHAEETKFFGSTEIPMHILQKAMVVTRKRAGIYKDIVSQENSLENIKEGSVIFAAIPNLIEMAPIRSILKKAKNKGAYIITICSGETNEYQKYSDIQINFEGTKTSMDIYMFMVIVNLIKYDYCHRYVDDFLEDMYS